MKKVITFIITILCLSSLCLTVYAHPGKTDEQGGHYDWDTGEYHFHHGYPAHQHTDGVCPYDFDDKTAHGAGSSGGSSSTTKREEPESFEEKPSDDHTYSSGSSKGPSNSSQSNNYSSKNEIEKSNKITSSKYFDIILAAIVIIGYLFIMFILPAILLPGKSYKERKKFSSFLKRKNNELKFFLKRKRGAPYYKTLATDIALFQIPKAQALIASYEKAQEIQNRIDRKKQLSVARLKKTQIQQIKLLRFLFLDKNNELIKYDLNNETEKEIFTTNKKIAKEILSYIDMRTLIPDAPEDIGFDKTNSIVYLDCSAKLPYGKYTVYQTDKTKKLHLPGLCNYYYSSDTSISIFEIDTADLCQRCLANSLKMGTPPNPCPQWYKDYLFIKQIKEYYKISN
ncbi:MAG: YHYH domain-containing protein [Oscillospiraceae bacterium]|nr:YHYH domain-containing protein [Oscillospiraceae bacterium]